jgi:hypothetical protein
VRDEIAHAGDHEIDPVTCSASEVLALGSGFCYAKSHLLAALLRANSIAAGFAYQRLAYDDGSGHCLHGLNAVWLADVGWFRVDARGRRADLREALFDPPAERLPFAATGPGEIFFPGAWASPAPIVVRALSHARLRTDLLRCLPDAVDLGTPDVRITH